MDFAMNLTDTARFQAELRAAARRRETRGSEPSSDCAPCRASLLAKVKELSGAPLPKLTLCVNTYNEGEDVRNTVESFRSAYRGPFEAVVVADGTTDGSCDDLPEYCRVIRNDERIGCGKSKRQSTAAATGDVIVYADGHCRVIEGDLEEMARICASGICILAPGVAPLHCQPSEPTQAGYKGGSTSFGGFVWVAPHGARYESRWRPKALLEERTATWNAIFMMSRGTVARLGGWNAYPGRWGSQEIGLALRAWFAAVPIYAYRDTVCGHRYRNWNGGRNVGPYGIRTTETRANHIYSHAAVFDPETTERVWKPIWRETTPTKHWWEVLARSDLSAQSELFGTACKRRTDAEFFETFCPDGMPRPPVPCDDITAIVLCYRRPRSQQRCVDAIRKHGIRRVWAWCNAGARPPRGATRVFTDSGNASTWARYAVAALAPTPWILFCDDDVELTGHGMMALRAGAAKWPGRNIGLIGSRFRPPFDSYRRRTFRKAHQITLAEPVDMLWPKGQLLPRDLAQQVFGAADLWQRMREAVGSTSGDDLVAVVAQSLLGHKPSLVVPAGGKPYKEHAEASAHALSADGRRMKRKRGTVRLWREMGWRPVEEGE
jgi:glycosyltransferase involved in cell wall biosynthesis